MPVDRPSTNSLAKRKAGSKRKLAETGDGHYFFTLTDCVTFLDLEAVGKAGLGDHDSPAGGSVLQVGPTPRATH